jgi:hypothetical protein
MFGLCCGGRGCQSIGLVCVCIGAAACASRVLPATPPAWGIHEALLRVVSDSGRIQIRVDPNPLPPTLDATQAAISPTASGRDQARTEEAANMVSVALRGESEDIRTACSGPTVPPADPGKPDPHRGCPKTAETIVVMGRPRIVSGPCRKSRVVVSPSASAQACGTIRAVVAHVSPFGVTAASFDCIFERQQENDWRLVGRELLDMVE